ncbi:type I restriction endonuclease subunit R [Alkalicoccus urumqiensis]|uniref:Type I restriction enzyme endonuclease subunit n=1 Tax=Alkalicoccus urumqiensis TaxID=1548213 RepID=A0A2P6MH89_ALKUR|nr:HsdR family type I site-specific deoxyribonuclease [Alkalicoccus urumqiensis]PRO65652.1 deoxyribonuclease [Alkalicoccus urumqiensis]
MLQSRSHRSEAEIESHLIEVLGEGHNQWTFRADLKSEADLWQNLRQKITQNNLSELGDTLLTDKEFEAIKTELLFRTQTPFDAAKWLKGENGIARITIEREDSSLGSVSLVLYSNQDIGGGISSYEVVNQIAKKSDRSEGRDRRFDVTLLINGLPIVQIELKKVTAKDGVYQAFHQVKKYAEEGMFRNNIFSTLQLFVVSNESTTRYFANAMPKNMHRKLMFSWRTKDNKKVENLYEFCKQALNIPDAHRLIANYTIVSEDQDNKALMVLQPYQIHAIEALFTSANKHQSGYVWHATGSGKTLTSFVSTKLLAKKSGIDRTIMLVDRKDLDNQTTSEFTKFASEFNTGISSGNTPANSLIVGTGSSKELSKTLLADANSNVVIITTRQKLDSALKYAKQSEEKKGTNRYEKLMGQHIVFIVDECHRALGAENMEEIKSFFPNSTWFGFTGTPIFEENKKQAKGQLARTTFDQYGDVLHTYTIKNALEDGSVLGFQVEHETTIDPTSLDNMIYHKLQQTEGKSSPAAINKRIDNMTGVEKEKYIESSMYEEDEHIDKVIRKILQPDNAYTKFDFKNGKPTKSAILTTSSIDMAKRYYKAMKRMTGQDSWMEREFSDRPIREGRTIDDPDFPRIAITYSLDENTEDAKDQQEEMQGIIDEYNDYYHTSWSLRDMERYNGDINNRLARKRAEFQQHGRQIDLVIVVDRLLTGFDAPTIQTLFVDRNLEYAGLIQAFSRTNRTYPEKTKGLIVTYRKPYTMEQHVADATKLYSEVKEESGLIYPSYDEAKKRFKKAHQQFAAILEEKGDVSDQSPVETRVDYVKAFQELNNSYEALVTYDNYNTDIYDSGDLQGQVDILKEEVGVYETVKGSLIDLDSGENDGEEPEFTGLSFYSDANTKLYDIDSKYIDQLLGTYEANNPDVREEIEQALQKLNKADLVKEVYRSILNAIDADEIDAAEDIFAVKRRFFTEKKEAIIHAFSTYWHVSINELHASAIQYVIGTDSIPNMKSIIESKDYDAFKAEHPEIKPFSYPQKMKREWQHVLDEQIVPLDDELR